MRRVADALVMYLLVFLCPGTLASSPLAADAPWVIPGFAIEPWCTSIPDVLGIGCPPPGSPFTSFLYAGTRSSGTLYEVDASGQATTFVTGLGSTIDGLAFASGPEFGNILYLSVNSASKVAMVFSGGGTATFATFPNRPHGPILFDASGSYGGTLFFGMRNTSGLLRLNADGTFEFFSPGPQIEVLSFGRGGFGTGMYAGDGTDLSIMEVEPDGTSTTRTAGGLLNGPVGMAFADGGPFGEYLYTGSYIPKTVLRYDTDFAVEIFAGGFSNIFSSHALAFGVDGNLYIGDYGAGTIYQVRPVSTSVETTTWGDLKRRFR